MRTVIVNGDALTVQDVIDVARGEARAELGPGVDTIPTSGRQEDHVSMGWTAVRKLRQVTANVRTCLAVEILCAAQGLDLRSHIAPPSAPMAAAHAAVRDRVARMDADREVAGH